MNLSISNVASHRAMIKLKMARFWKLKLDFVDFKEEKMGDSGRGGGVQINSVTTDQ